MAIVELVPVELTPQFDALVEVWIAIFGRSESSSVSGICRQWEADFRTGIARRAIFDVARQRFPIQVKPLVRLLRAMTGSGFLDTDSLSTADSSHEGGGLSEERKECDTCVSHFLYKLPTFSQVLPLSACTSAHAIYERQPERYGSSKTNSVICTSIFGPSGFLVGPSFQRSQQGEFLVEMGLTISSFAGSINTLGGRSFWKY